MALRLSGILLGGIVIVYDRKVKLLHDDVTRLMLEINSVWKVKQAGDPTLLPKGKSQAKREAITLPENEETNVEDDKQYLQPSDTATKEFFSTHFVMQLDRVDVTYISNGAREPEPSHNHQVELEKITLDEGYESHQANADPFFERFQDGEDENAQILTFIPSTRRQVDPTRGNIIRDQRPVCDVIQQSDQCVGRQDHRIRKRKQPQKIIMDSVTVLSNCTIGSSLNDVSRGRNRQRSGILSRAKIADLMELPPVVLFENLFKNGTRDVQYPAPILELWNRSSQPHKVSPSASTEHKNIPNEDELEANFDNGSRAPENTPQVTPRNSENIS